MQSSFPTLVTDEPLRAYLLDQMAEMVIVLDMSLNVHWLNQRARQRLVLLEGANWLDGLSLPAGSLKRAKLSKRLNALGSGDILELDCIPLCTDNGTLMMSGTATGFSSECQGTCGILLVLRDVTAELAEEAELRLSAKVFESSGEAIMITDPDDRILAVNAAFTVLTGFELAEVKGRTPAFLGAGKQKEGFYEDMWAAVHRDGHWKGEVWNRKKNGEVYPEWLAITAVRNRSGDIDHYISIFSDITERKAEEEHIRHLAQHDFLTGLPNRVLLRDRFEQAVALSKRGRPHPIALLFIDLDGFKAINDAIGHDAGDRLLQEVSQRLTSCVRDTDTVCRHGGDEFIVLLPDIQSRDAIPTIAAKILQVLHYSFVIESHPLSVTASIGISLYPEHGQSLLDLMSSADQAMYEAKRQGKNRWSFSATNPRKP